jgi:hypothetical protein
MHLFYGDNIADVVGDNIDSISATTGAWSEGLSSLRGALSMLQALHSKAALTSIWSIRSPMLRRNAIMR